MSRGLSDQQHRILDYIDQNSKSAPVTFETLRWSLGISDCNGNLTPSSNNSLRRATNKLEEHGHISIEERKLADFESCVLFYPDKTPIGTDRRLRQILLPTLHKWISDSGSGLLKYGQSENEVHYLSQMQKDELDEFSKEWREIEDLLRPYFARCSHKHSDQLLHLICRGKRLFELGSVTSHLPLLGLIQKVIKQGTLPKLLSNRIDSFGKRLFPKQDVSKMKFHSQIHSLANISSHQPYELREDTILFLREKHKDLVDSLSDRQERKGHWRYPFQVNYEKPLKRLFNNSVFTSFKHLSLN